MIDVNDALEIATSLHECQVMFDDPFSGQGRQDADDLQVDQRTTTNGVRWKYDVNSDNYATSGFCKGDFHWSGIATALVYGGQDDMTLLMKLMVQNQNSTSKAAERARAGAHVTWILPTNWTSKGSWGRLENGKVGRTCSVLEPRSVVALRGKAANKKRKKSDESEKAALSKKQKPTPSKSSTSSSSSSSPPSVTTNLPNERPNFRLSVADVVTIHRALHDAAKPASVLLPNAGVVLKIARSSSGGRVCHIIVDQSRPKGFAKIMTQNLTKNSEYAQRGRNGEKISWVLPLDLMTGKHVHSSKWGRIENEAEEMAKKSILAVE